MEIETGRAIRLTLVEERLWYAPWKKRAKGIVFNRYFISFKQPAPAKWNKAIKKCSRVWYWGRRGRLGNTEDWRYIFEEKQRINDFLRQHGGSPLPDEVMTEDVQVLNSGSCEADISAGALKNKKFQYRPLIKKP